MTRSRWLCEGRDDLVALRAVANVCFGLRPGRAETADGRTATLTGEGVEAKVRVAKNGKTGLLEALKLELEALGPFDPAEPRPVDRIVLVFDPDDEPDARFHISVDRDLGSAVWTLSRDDQARPRWTAQRSEGEQVEVAAFAWRGSDAPLDDLPNRQNLERLLLTVASAVIAPAYRVFLEQTLRGIAALGETPNWKSAVHLLCALIDPGASTEAPAERFLAQGPAFARKTPEILRALTIDGTNCFDELAALFGVPAPAAAAPSEPPTS